MKTLSILAAAALLFSVPGLAADDPIAVRQALMASNGSAAGLSGAVMKGELDYTPAIGKAAINSMHAAAMAFGDYFPEGSDDASRSEAAPKIWEDMEGFRAKLQEFQSATGAAAEASGKDGPADAQAFAAAMRPVLDTCKACHEDYRLED